MSLDEINYYIDKKGNLPLCPDKLADKYFYDYTEEIKYKKANPNICKFHKLYEPNKTKLDSITDALFDRREKLILKELKKEYNSSILNPITKMLKYKNLYDTYNLRFYAELSKKYGVNIICDILECRGNDFNDEKIPDLLRYYNKYGRSRVKKILSITNDIGDIYWIASGHVDTGYTKEMARLAWGLPYKINRTTSGYGVREQWCYSNNRYLYFDDGILSVIQD